jgi:predicted phage tail component-like protein
MSYDIDFIYNGRAGVDEGIVLVRNIRRDILPPIQSRMIKLSGRHGAYYFGRTYEERSIAVDVVLSGVSHQSLRDRVRSLASWLNSDDVQQLIITDEPDKYYKAVVFGKTDLEQLVAEGEGTIFFLCPDPFAYAITPQTVTMTTSPLAHTQAGTAPADPLLRLQGVSTGAGGQQISIAIGGQTVTYRGALATGDWLEIDCQAKTVFRVVGATRTRVLALLERPVFPQFAPGINTITITAAGGATWSRLELHCRNRWL